MPSPIPNRQPVIFLPHGGGPCFFMPWTWGPADTWDKTRAFLESIPASLAEKPKALLVISGHWEETLPTVSTAAHPELIFDYSGFPPETYQLTWPAPGSPALAARVQSLLQQSGLPVATSPDRGYDHGVFIPLKVAFPAADIPVVTLSLARSLDPAFHIAVGRALAPLRDEGVLVIASGMSFHNLRAYFGPETLARSEQFDQWLTAAVESEPSESQSLLTQWSTAPGGRFAHPREEHLIPLMVAAGAGAGAGGTDRGRRVFHDTPMQAAISAYRWG